MSCLAQTYSNFELIVTDNSTNTQSAEVLAKIADPRIRYFKNEGNIGAHGSSSRAATMAQGKYIKFLMDDDLLKPKCLELMVAAFEKYPEVGIVMAPMELIDENDKRIFPKFYFVRTMQYRYRYQVGDGLIERKRLLKDFLTRDYPCTVPSGIMYRAEPIKKMLPFDPALAFAGDLDICMQIAGYTTSITSIRCFQAGDSRLVLKRRRLIGLALNSKCFTLLRDVVLIFCP